MVEKIERKSLTEQVYDQIKAEITSGTWKIGERIPKEADLMAEFGISRNTLREAIRALAHIGLLETKQGDGTFVRNNSELHAIMQKRVRESSVQEILEIRHALDREAVILACERRTKEDLATMEKYRGLCHVANENNDVTAFVKADSALHLAIVKAAHNDLLIDMYGNILEEIQFSITSTTEMDPAANQHGGHAALVSAIEKRNKEQAANEVTEYITLFKRIAAKNGENK
ncbi:FadR/GntR family transcriptional regulator [Listeria cossartiae subsp. cayugensis]|uniref:FadR/GntR family transcriptional regulator n=1 Tax=Listeria cossartiae TaxID=2838249 RepID=UPI00287FFDD5|nr:FadR/GntR family transcriptional regulator [Listeria cossartiae]MDS9999374.1 FadR/GntR family transcriptional regulator [Listeria cossartiae subsp. cayugensis]MDT0008179.1 FadR/GntR family transcriptional regulator [Listeria cossartiae subsp. cayugensis]MDT0013605.1 FadR/GntR family transcriptional regulator [Listeria cossartiae subsp. cayugensis]MDT0029406.1 FadR/GntR family transcriptional regulator [Listeria cossartiae subsp. cayugensis]MDT0037521.1 FadR/GntR family transcriptional regul